MSLPAAWPPLLTPLERVGFESPAPRSSRRCSLPKALPSSVCAPSSTALTVCPAALWLLVSKRCQRGGSGSQRWRVQREEGGWSWGQRDPRGLA